MVHAHEGVSAVQLKIALFILAVIAAGASLTYFTATLTR
jgi:hypothetical protein